MPTRLSSLTLAALLAGSAHAQTSVAARPWWSIGAALQAAPAWSATDHSAGRDLSWRGAAPGTAPLPLFAIGAGAHRSALHLSAAALLPPAAPAVGPWSIAVAWPSPVRPAAPVRPVPAFPSLRISFNTTY